MMERMCELTYGDLSDWVSSRGGKEFLARQIFDWVYGKSVLDWDGMNNVSKEWRKALSASFHLGLLQLAKTESSDEEETRKFLWRLPEGNFVESVLICSGPRRTVCVSSQVGCPVRCAFCASGQRGFVRNLRPAEIVEQVVQINHHLKERGERVSHVVFMGMGEPFKNYDAVMRSIKLLTAPEGLNISQRRITVSTVGITEGIHRFTEEGLKVNLVLSLHAPNQKIRQKIIPYARKYPLDEIMAAMDRFSLKTKRDVTYEYVLIAGVNDHPDHAFELSGLLRGKQCTVNLIPYNPVAGVHLATPSNKAVKQFRAVLCGAKIPNTRRYTKGRNINAACGQLALHESVATADNPEPHSL